MTDRFDELVGEVDDPRERERLRRVHELLLAAEPPPDIAVGPSLVFPKHKADRRRVRPLALLAAALAVASFGAGWLVGGREPAPERVVTMDGVGTERDATASIRLLPQDEAGN